MAEPGRTQREKPPGGAGVSTRSRPPGGPLDKREDRLTRISFDFLGRHGTPGDKPPAPPPITLETGDLADAATAVRAFAHGYLTAPHFVVYVEHGSGEGWITATGRRLVGRFLATVRTC